MFSLKRKKALVKTTMTDWAVIEKANIAMVAAVSLVSCQPKFPEPKTTRTICALKTIIKAEAVIDQK